MWTKLELAFAVIVAGATLSQGQTTKIRVISEDDHKPLSCRIQCINPDGKTLTIGETDPLTGEIAISVECKPGVYYLLLPKFKDLFYPERITCTEATQHDVQLGRITQPSIKGLASELSFDLDNVRIEDAVTSNKIAKELGTNGKGLGYMTYAQLVFAKMLDVETPFTFKAKSGSLVISDSFSQKLRSLQHALQLPVTGTVDSETLEATEGIVVAYGSDVLKDATLPAGARRNTH